MVRIDFFGACQSTPGRTTLSAYLVSARIPYGVNSAPILVRDTQLEFCRNVLKLPLRILAPILLAAGMLGVRCVRLIAAYQIRISSIAFSVVDPPETHARCLSPWETLKLIPLVNGRAELGSRSAACTVGTPCSPSALTWCTTCIKLTTGNPTNEPSGSPKDCT